MSSEEETMDKENNRTRAKRKSKYDELIHIDAHPLDVIRSLFSGKPKPRDQWKFVQEDKRRRERGE